MREMITGEHQKPRRRPRTAVKIRARSASLCSKLRCSPPASTIPAPHRMLALATSLLSADAPSGGPPQWQVHLQSALQAHQSGDLSAAAPLYKAALDGHAPLRQSWQVLNNYGLSIQSEDPEAAAASFREVLALPGQHENADAYFNLGNALATRRRTRRRSRRTARRRSSHPTTASSRRRTAARCCRRARRPRRSRRCAAARCATRRRAAPTGAPARTTRSATLALERAWPGSAAYRDALAARPAHAPGWASLEHARGARAVRRAEASWRKALEMAPGGDGTLLNLGGMLRRSERMGEARDAFERAVGTSPENAEAYMALGKCYQAPKAGWRRPTAERR